MTMFLRPSYPVAEQPLNEQVSRQEFLYRPAGIK